MHKALYTLMTVSLMCLSACQRNENVELCSWQEKVDQAMNKAGLPSDIRDPRRECLTNCAQAQNGCLDSCDQRIEYGNPARTPCHDECVRKYEACAAACTGPAKK
jgi:hypothetical protein